MSTEEALALVHGDMATIRDGDVTHQCIQTNLADVICGGKNLVKTKKKQLHKKCHSNSLESFGIQLLLFAACLKIMKKNYLLLVYYIWYFI